MSGALLQLGSLPNQRPPLPVASILVTPKGRHAVVALVSKAAAAFLIVESGAGPTALVQLSTAAARQVLGLVPSTSSRISHLSSLLIHLRRIASRFFA